MTKQAIIAELKKLGIKHNARLGADKLNAVLEAHTKAGPAQADPPAPPAAPSASDGGELIKVRRLRDCHDGRAGQTITHVTGEMLEDWRLVEGVDYRVVGSYPPVFDAPNNRAVDPADTVTR